LRLGEPLAMAYHGGVWSALKQMTAQASIAKA
jgi:hypothetical protein